MQVNLHCSLGKFLMGRALLAVAFSACFIMLGLIVSPPQANAQTARLEEIIVSASKRGNTNLQDVPASIIAFDTDTLNKMGVEEFVDFSRSVPGLDVIDTGPGQKQYLIRGLSGPGESTVGVYYDNIPMSGSGQSPVSFGGNQPDLDTYDAERIEVLRGPQGTLYGASSLSGVVRIVSNKPDASESSGKITIDGANTSGGDGSYSAKGMINLPIVEDVFAVRAVAYYDRVGGFIDNGVLLKGPADNSCYVRGDSIGQPDPEVVLDPSCQDGQSQFTNVNEHERKGGRIFAQWNIDDDSSLLFQSFFQNTTSTGRNAANPIDSEYFIGPPFIAGGNRFFTPAVGDDQTSIRGHEPYDEDLQLFALEYNRNFDSASLTATLSYMDRDADSRIDSSSPARLHRRFNETPLGPWGGVTVSPFDRVTVAQVQNTELFNFEVRLASQLDGQLNYLVGAFHSDRTLDIDSKVYATDPRTGQILMEEGTFLDRLATNETQVTAAYGELYYDATNKLELLAGARWFRTERDQFSNLIVPFLRSPIIGGPPGIEPNMPDTETDTIFKAQATYKFDEDKSLYLQFAEGFRAGGVNAQITPTIPESFESDQTSNIELGFKSLWMDGRLLINAALYQITWDNVQMKAAFTSQFNGLVNCTEESDPIESNGFEVDVQYAFNENLKAGINYTKLDATWQVDADSCVSADVLAQLSDPLGAESGDKLVGVPDFSGSAFLQYDWELGNGSAFVRADVQFQGEVDVNEPRASRNIANPSYTFGHIKAGYEWDNYAISIYAKNVTDEDAWLSLFNNFQQENRVTVNQPRTFGANFEIRF